MTKKKKEKKDVVGYGPYIMIGIIVFLLFGALLWGILEISYGLQVMTKEYAHNGLIYGNCYRLGFGRLRCEAINTDELCEHGVRINPYITLDSIENPEVIVEDEVVCNLIPIQYAIEV